MTDKQQSIQHCRINTQIKDNTNHTRNNERKENNKRISEHYRLKKDPKEIVVLKYEPANNLSKFNEAIPKKTLKDCGQFGKQIKLGKYSEYDFVNDPMHGHK